MILRPAVCISSYSEMAEDENTANRRPRFSMCNAIVNITVCRAIHHLFIAEIMAPYAWNQMLPQIYSITIAFHLSIANRAHGFVFGSHQHEMMVFLPW